MFDNIENYLNQIKEFITNSIDFINTVLDIFPPPFNVIIKSAIFIITAIAIYKLVRGSD